LRLTNARDGFLEKKTPAPIPFLAKFPGEWYRSHFEAREFLLGGLHQV
jgi:hypothetical protein